MLTRVNKRTIDGIRNPDFAAYARMYVDIEEDYLEQIASFGVPFAEPFDADAVRDYEQALLARGAHVENCDHSVWINWISPACLTCRKGVGTSTFLISVQCPRDCWFCFNPNQMNYDTLRHEMHDVTADLVVQHQAGVPYVDLALTGGEPLIHADETMEFFAKARELYPDAYMRLYTSGAYLTDELFARLRDTGLDEIRFSIKTDDTPEQQDVTFGRIARAKEFIPQVMVEMPVMPDGAEDMKALLRRLDKIGVAGINLLELCFPLHNAEAFTSRGYRLKNPPYQILYNYWYAGGIPVDGSEQACLDLIDFALDEDLSLGIHYCSLENKFTGQIYLQNKMVPPDGIRTMSERDYFIKSAKVFGMDAKMLRSFFSARADVVFLYDADEGTLEFPLAAVAAVAKQFPSMEAAVSYYVAEGESGADLHLRELALDYTTLSDLATLVAEGEI